jgi:hypothetical protein
VAVAAVAVERAAPEASGKLQGQEALAVLAALEVSITARRMLRVALAARLVVGHLVLRVPAIQVMVEVEARVALPERVALAVVVLSSSASLTRSRLYSLAA